MHRHLLMVLAPQPFFSRLYCLGISIAYDDVFSLIGTVYGGWWRWSLVSPDGVAPSRVVSVSASVIYPCTIKSRISLLAPAHPGGPEKRAVNGCGTELLNCVISTRACLCCGSVFLNCTICTLLWPLFPLCKVLQSSDLFERGR